MEPTRVTWAQTGGTPTPPGERVQWGTWPGQITVTGTVEDVVTRGRDAGLEQAVVAVIGDVVDLRRQTSWFDTRPLSGKQVLITRSRPQASTLRSSLAATRGGRPPDRTLGHELLVQEALLAARLNRR